MVVVGKASDPNPLLCSEKVLLLTGEKTPCGPGTQFNDAVQGMTKYIQYKQMGDYTTRSPNTGINI